jgi:cytochrome subunit of sulfide dehydrogenase
MRGAAPEGGAAFNAAFEGFEDPLPQCATHKKETANVIATPKVRQMPIAAAVLLAASAAFAQPTAATLNTRALAATCANCHGTDGRAVAGDAMVALAGLPQATIVEQMQAFRDGKRPATVMHQIVKGYSDEQIQALAAYFAAQKK